MPDGVLGSIRRLKLLLCRVGLHHYEWHPDVPAIEDRVKQCQRCGKTMAYRARWVEISDERIQEIADE